MSGIHDFKGNVLKGTDNGDGTFSISGGGGGGGGGAVTVADGADVALGSTTDAAVSTDASGTINAHIRGLVKLIAAGIAVTQRALSSGTDSVTTVPSGTQNTNQTQWAGTAVDVNSGNASAGTARVVLATNQPALTNALKVDGSAVTQPVSGTVTANAGSGTMAVSAAALPLPTGASTSAKQPALGTAGTASSDVISVQGVTGMTAVKVDGSAVTQPVSAAALPLPTGASTAAKQPALGTAGTASADVISVQGVASMTALKTDGSAVTQPVSATTLPLPTGASTAAKQPALGTAGTASSDVITVQGVASMTALKVDGSAVTQPVSAASLPLPTGAATSANQTTGNTSLNNIDTHTPALGQTTMSGSSPVTIASDQSAVSVLLAAGSNLAGSVKISDGTNVANVMSGDSGQNPILTAPTRKEVSFSVTTNQAVASTDCSNFRYVSVHLTAAATGSTQTFQVSNDNVNWVTQSLLGSNGAGNAFPVNSITGAGSTIYAGPISGRYFRINITGITSGTSTGVVEFFSTPPGGGFDPKYAYQGGAWTVTSNAAAATTGGYSYSHLAANATTTVKSGAGTLHSITINTLGTADTVTVYDNTAGSGTVIAIINSAVTQATLLYDLAFTTGLTIVIAGTTAPDITVTYK